MTMLLISFDECFITKVAGNKHLHHHLQQLSLQQKFNETPLTDSRLKVAIERETEKKRETEKEREKKKERETEIERETEKEREIKIWFLIY